MIEQDPFESVVTMGSPASHVSVDALKNGNVRIHFGGEAFAWVALSASEATQMGVLLIQAAQASATAAEKGKIVMPDRLS